MSRLDRIIGLARSLLVYHAIPWRQRRMQRLYRQFARPARWCSTSGRTWATALARWRRSVAA
jgi:hypothetical protein